MLMKWVPELSVGVAAFDADHQKLVGYLNELHDAALKGHSADVIDKIIVKLAAYTVEHFKREETAFAKYGYPAGVSHIKEHQALIAKVGDYQKKLAAGNKAIGLEVCSVLQEWLKNHIMKSDKGYQQFLNGKGMH